MKNLIWNFLRQCHVCGDYKFKPIHFLCGNCKLKLIEYSQSSPKQLYLNLDFPTYTWCNWTDKNDHFIRPIIYGLKGGYLKHAIYEFCEYATYDLNKLFKAQPLLLPAPARNLKEPDHAYQIALGLAQIYGLKIINVFERTQPNTHQKSKSKNQRQILSLKLNSNMTKQQRQIIFDSDQPLLFIDDLITTGSTAKHAYIALNNSYKFSAFSLFYRTLNHHDY